MLISLLATAASSPPPILLVPFVLLLLLIAVMPLTPAKVHHWWEHNYPWVSGAFAVAVGGYYLWRMPGGGTTLAHSLHEYVSFIALIGSLFVVAGGIHLRVKSESTCWENVLFLAIGAVLANVIGTTGASVVLIRPWIRMNKVRISAYHIVFFIFIVSNLGGSLTPIGDPPLFLGYLRGVPFFWLIEHVWQEWLVTVGLVLGAFYFYDRHCFSKMPKALQREVREHDDTFQVRGWRNLGLLAVIVVGVFLPETYFVREIVMVAAAVISFKATPEAIHRDNHFSFGPIKEVAFLFLGIFTTMMPALAFLEANGAQLGFKQPKQYYFATGGLSAVLDNAPTYMNFLKLAETTFGTEAPETPDTDLEARDHDSMAQLLTNRPQVVVAISLGAVFFGAMTYIGNGPNFMVKAIAQNAGVHCPTFFGYIFKYSVPILLPILILSAWLFV